MRQAVQRLVKMPFLRDAAVLQAGMWFTTVMQAITGILTARLLGVEQYGLFALVLTAVGTIGAFANIGQSFSALTLLSEGYARRSRDEADSALAHYVQCCVYWMLPLTLSASVLSFVAPVGPETRWWLALGFLTLPPMIVTDFMSLVFQGTRRIPALTKMESIFAVIDAVLPLAFLLSWPSITSLLCGRLLSSILRALVALCFWYTELRHDPLLPGLAVRRWLLRTPFQRQALKLAGWIAADVQVDRIFRQIPYYLLGFSGQTAAVGQFRALMSYVDLSNALSGSAGRLLSSVLPSLYVKDEKAFERSFWKANLANLAVSGAILMVLLAAGNSLLTLLYGEAFAVPTLAFVFLSPLVLNGITVGFGTYYRIHRALPLVIWAQCVSAGSSLAIWFAFRGTLDPLLDTVLAFATANLVSKFCHIVNLNIVQRRLAGARQ